MLIAWHEVPTPFRIIIRQIWFGCAADKLGGSSSRIPQDKDISSESFNVQGLSVEAFGVGPNTTISFQFR